VGFVGRVVPIKDVKTFISAAKIISETIQEAHFYCVGPIDEDKAYYEDCKLLVKSFQIDNRLEFTGQQDVRKYYEFLDVVMLTSIREAQPLVVLEAFCCGIPVVSTKVGNVLEMLDFDERFLAASKDPKKLAFSVKLIYDNPKLMAALLKKKQEKIFKFFDRKEVHKKYGELYLQLKEKNYITDRYKGN